MTTPPPSPEAVPPRVLPGWRRWVLTVLSVLLLLTFLGITVAYLFGYSFVRYFVQSPAGQRIASTSVGHAIKVDGEFAPLHLDKWVIITDSFTSTGWPGEAIGGLNVYGIRAEFDPGAVWHGVWHIKGITIEHGNFILRTPNNALKRPTPPKKPKPWYAHFLPSVFQCGPIVTPDANVDFEFQDKHAQIAHAQLRADLIGKDFRYTATSGTLNNFPYLPSLHIGFLRVMVTRPMVTIEDAELSGIDPADPARMSIQAQLGQHEDKTIKAIIDVTEMPIEQMMPTELATLVHGRMTGHVTWDRDKTGKDIYSDGDVDLAGASIDNISVFKMLTVLHGNPDLLNFTFDALHVKFHLKDGIFTARLLAVANGKFVLNGTVAYELATNPRRCWTVAATTAFGVLPTDFEAAARPGPAGILMGQLRSVKDSSATLAINLDNTHVNNPPLLRSLLKKTKLRTPDQIDFKTAEFNFTYQNQVFTLTRAQIDAPGFIAANATGTLATPDKTLDAVMTWNGLKLADWLPEKMARELSGDLNGGVQLHVRQWKFKDGSYGGDLQLVRGELRYTSAQSAFARWVKDPELLQIPVTQAALSWTWDAGALTVSDVDLRGDDAFAVQGNLAMSADGALSGNLSVGLRDKYLKSLMGLGNAVFTRKADGLLWAHVTVSGTLKKPKQDLGSQLMAQLPSHPLAVVGLGGRMVSWFVGNWFGAAEDWKRPQPAPSVVVTPAK